MSQLVLSLFPGLGLLDMAFEQSGFCVVRGPDVLWGGDVRRFHPPPGVFSGIAGGPPCQAFSSLAHLVRANGHEPRFGNLIPEFERCIAEALPAWFLMENVPAAPEPVVSGYGVTSFLLDNSRLDDGTGWGHEQRRVRRFSFGQRGVERPPSLLRWIDLAVFVLPDAELAVRSQPAPGGDGFQHSAAGREAKVKRTAVNADHSDPNESLTTARRSRKQRLASVTSNVSGGGSNAVPQPGKAAGGKGRYRLADALRLQGLPEDFLADAPFTAEGKLKAVANGVCLHTGLAIAKAILCALSEAGA